MALQSFGGVPSEIMDKQAKLVGAISALIVTQTSNMIPLPQDSSTVFLTLSSLKFALVIYIVTIPIPKACSKLKCHYGEHLQ